MTAVNRRRVVAGVAGGLSLALLAPTRALSRDRADVVIAGGGLAGLNAGISLQDAGLSVIVLEAGRRPGGRVHTDYQLPGQPELGATEVGPLYARVRDMARRLEGTGVTINVVSPGYFIKTNVYRHVRGIFKLAVWLMGPFMTDPERAAKTYVFLANSPEVEGISGKYWEYCKEKASSAASHDGDLQRRVWDYSIEVTGLV